MDQKGKRGAAPQATLHILIDALSLYIANIPVHVVSHKNEVKAALLFWRYIFKSRFRGVRASPVLNLTTRHWRLGAALILFPF